jgi:dUTPase
MIDNEKIGFELLEVGAKEPKYNGSILRIFSKEKVRVCLHTANIIKTGISIKIPEGYVGMIHGRVKIEKGIVIETGIIDSAYSAEIKLVTTNIGNNDELFLEEGEEIAGIILQMPERLDLEEIKGGHVVDAKGKTAE